MFYKFCVVLVRFIMLFVVRLKREGIENIPKNGALILAVNHKSDLDPVVTAITCPRQLTFMAKKELFKNPVFGALIKKLGAFPVNRGIGDISAVKAAFSIFKKEGVMLIFPEGGRVKKGQTRRAKPGVAMIAQKACVPVVPVHIIGDFKWTHKVIVRYGKPITYTEYEKKKLSGEEIQALADNVLEKIYKL